MARMISIAKTNSSPLGNGTGIKLSKLILIDKLECHPTFENLYVIDQDRLERISQNMKEKNFDGSQPVNVWKVKDSEGNEHFYLIDGYTRRKAAILAGLEAIPYFEHTEFQNESEALKYAIHLQVDRRNLEPIDLLRNIEKLMSSDYIQNFEGDKNTEIGRLLGISKDTVMRNKYVISNATEDQLAQIENGEISAKALSAEIKKQKFIEENATEDQIDMIESGAITSDEVFQTIKKTKSKKDEPDEDEEENSYVDTDGTPRGISFQQRKEDDSPKLEPPKDDDWIKAARMEGFSNGFYKAFCYALAQVSNGKTPSEIWNSVPDFSPSEICKFELSDEDEKIALNL